MSSYPCCPYCKEWKRRALRSENFWRKSQIQDSLEIAISVLEGKTLTGEMGDLRDERSYTEWAIKWLKGLMR